MIGDANLVTVDSVSNLRSKVNNCMHHTKRPIEEDTSFADSLDTYYGGVYESDDTFFARPEITETAEMYYYEQTEHYYDAPSFTSYDDRLTARMQFSISF